MFKFFCLRHEPLFVPFFGGFRAELWVAAHGLSEGLRWTLFKGNKALTFDSLCLGSPCLNSNFSKGFTMKMFSSFPQWVSLCAVASLSSVAAFAAPQTGSAKVTAVSGNVLLDAAAAKVGDVANPGSTISTGPESKASLFLGVNGPDVNVLDNSKLKIDELTFDTSGAETVINTALGLSEGTVEGYVKKTSSQSSYTVKTPTTTAAIRGTTYTIKATGAVLVWEGCVDVGFRDPGSARVSNFNVCANQMFDPGVPGVVDIPANTPHPSLNISGKNNQQPVGPKAFVSPVKGR